MPTRGGGGRRAGAGGPQPPEKRRRKGEYALHRYIPLAEALRPAGEADARAAEGDAWAAICEFYGLPPDFVPMDRLYTRSQVRTKNNATRRERRVGQRAAKAPPDDWRAAPIVAACTNRTKSVTRRSAGSDLRTRAGPPLS